MGERYGTQTEEFSDLMLGYYGSTLGEKNAEVLAQAQSLTGKEVITGRPADLLKPEWDQLKSEAAALANFDGSDEDVLTYAMFPSVAETFFKSRPEGPKNLGKDPAKAA